MLFIVNYIYKFYLLCQSSGDQSASPSAVLKPPLPQFVELSGSESPSVMGWNIRHQRVRQDISRTRLRAIESSLENGQVWVPPSPAHRKTWEEEVTTLITSFLWIQHNFVSILEQDHNFSN